MAIPPPLGALRERILGVDVSKDYLDTDTRSPTPKRRFTNNSAGSAALVAWVQDFGPERLVFESTGHYQKVAGGVRRAASLPAVVVNARQVRDLAKARGILAHTDASAAAVLARCGPVVPTVVRPLPAPEIQAVPELYERRGQLVNMLAVEKSPPRRHLGQGPQEHRCPPPLPGETDRGAGGPPG